MMKSRCLLLFCITNGLLLTALAPVAWQGVLFGLVSGILIYCCAFTSLSPLPLSAPSAVNAELAALLIGVLPEWECNIQLARNQTRHAIDQLSARFVDIHQRLSGALNLSSGGSDVMQVIQHAAQQLGGIASAIEQVVSTRQALLQQMAALAEDSQEIGRLFTQLHLTSVGEQNAAQTALQHISVRVHAVRSALQAAVDAADQLSFSAKQMVADSNSVIDNVIAEFRISVAQLNGTVAQLENESRQVDLEVCDILLNLQFQDRISQILDHVRSDMLRLQSVLDSGQPLPSPQQWLHTLYQSYTTDEERQRSGPASASHKPEQVEFF